jgi:hypothetical protein
MEYLAAALFGGFLFRMRGGLLPLGSTLLSRLWWVLPLAAFALATAPWPWALAFAAASYGTLALGWGSYMDLGRMPGEDNEPLKYVMKFTGLAEGSFAYDFVGMTLRGLVLTVPGVLIGEWAYVFAGLLMGAIYEASWRLWARRATELAECVFGALLGVALCF